MRKERREKRNFNLLTSKQALERMKSAQTIVVVGPTSSGKSTLIYALVNQHIIGFISTGIGDKCQTTIIPCNFLFDERINEDKYFSLRIRTKKFTGKVIHLEIMEMLANQFTMNGMCAEDTLDAIDEKTFKFILEPKNSAYHLDKIADMIPIKEFKKVIADSLSELEKAEPSFIERVNIKKKEYQKQKVLISIIRKMVFEEMWDELDSSFKEEYYNWLKSIGDKITDRLSKLMGTSDNLENINEYSAEKDDSCSYGGTILRTLFDPFQPFSLIVEDMVLACRPRHELIEKADENVPLRFCLRDTMGLNQIDMDNNSIKDALDIALNCSPDSILLLMSLEEREDVIVNSCEVINEKIGKAQKLDIPVNVIFTKADRIITNIISKFEKETLELTQLDYDKNITEAIAIMENSIQKYKSILPQESTTWLSIRYKEEKIDPIQIALHKIDSIEFLKWLIKFKPEGLYQKIGDIIHDTQQRILPNDMTNPLFVTVKHPEKPAVKIEINGDVISDIFKQIQIRLTEDKAIVNGYLITSKYAINGRSVVAYYNKLQHGQGHTTRAKVYGNFSINMKRMLNNILCQLVPNFAILYNSGAVGTVIDNLDEREVNRIVKIMDSNPVIIKHVCSDLNPALFDFTPQASMTQQLHILFKDYFRDTGKYYMVMDKVAFNLSYGNSKIQDIIDTIYAKYISYDATIRKMQETYKEIFATKDFADIIAEEIGNAMTDLINKMFIII